MTTNSLNEAVFLSSTEPFPSKSSYRASVPLSVYRELAQELKGTQQKIKRLEFQNQNLVQENQQLRQQIAAITRATEQLNQVVEQADSPKRVSSEIDLRQKNLKSSTKKLKSTEIFPLSSRNLTQIDIPPHAQRSLTQMEGEKTINGWVLALGIFLIVLTTCTGAFLIVNSRVGHKFPISVR
ncbi:hypothetical protein [Gloeothece verrucosa]|uniref:Uncharacterized protein n=1 Tax=Gloeothece verrucosa (strain PCC 7822) TaxID=497965 RepID=E0UF38_GLOV7|nr:hypothetical protein [Gloeothece verrucosa]ADN14290.1 conserved hypothetical protein [Gloeothece verrucosa PCC 7822]